jgi:uncharacterized membrane protein YedE/YeeE
LLALEKAGRVKIPPRSPSQIGLFSKYDANIIGGAALGVGMALSGACPGTTLAQIGVGVQSGSYAFVGSVLGGIIFNGFVEPWRNRRLETSRIEGTTVLTVYELLGISKSTAVLSFTIFSAAFVALLAKYAPTGSYAALLPVLGGLCLGLAQLVSLLTRQTLVGVSSTFEEISKHFWWTMGGLGCSTKPTSHKNIRFSLGLLVGAWLIGQLYPWLVIPSTRQIPPLQAVLGGILGIVGARIAGGCTSGHGISGMALFSNSSIITIAAVFFGGGLAATLTN